MTKKFYITMEVEADVGLSEHITAQQIEGILDQVEPEIDGSIKSMRITSGCPSPRVLLDWLNPAMEASIGHSNREASLLAGM